MARGLARAGARVVIAARDEAKSKDAVKELEAFGAEARAVTTDVTDEAAVGRMVRATLDAFGRLDVLVNNAGTNIRKPPHEVSLAEWRQVLDTSLTSAYLCSHAAYPAMKATGRGKIINIGSMMSIFGAGFAPAYAASKRSEEHTSELQSRLHLVCRLLLEKKKQTKKTCYRTDMQPPTVSTAIP